jgi:hypothetical protein
MKTPEELAEDFAFRVFGACYEEMEQEEKGRWGDAYHAFLAGYQAAAPQWISVKDRLPEAGSGLLIVYQSSLKELGTSYYDDDMWCSSLWPIVSKHITHWMPLPQPPKEEV